MFRSFALAQPGGSYFDMMPAETKTVAPKVEARAPRPEEMVCRVLDIVIALAAIAFFAPLMVIVALAVKHSGGPIIFTQPRIGRGGRSFACFKFRTMRVDGDAILEHTLANNPARRLEWERDRKLRRDPRVTKTGAILRKTSLDELPQLFNVLAGTMAIVGPRPIVEAEVPRYGRYFDAYCEVRPGITGLWQISGRNRTTYRRRVACDVTYVRSQSALLNFQIIMMTIPTVCFARGAY